MIESHGPGHLGRAENDSSRTQELEPRGCRVIRVANDDGLEDVKPVVAWIAPEAGMS